MRVYLDHAASSPVRPEAKAAIRESLELVGNPSAVHAEGRTARVALERARRAVAAVIGADALGGLVFTSGATEANAAALSGWAKSGVVFASAVEHPSILAQDRVETLPVDAAGRLDLASLEQRLAEGGVGCLALMVANNETGVIQPVAEAARLTRGAGVALHIDAVQGLGKLPIDVMALGCDSLALSAHKLGGPRGVGALWLREPDALPPWLEGGGQEARRRAGTENTSGIAAFAAAVQATSEAEQAGMAECQALLEAGALERAPDALVVGHAVARVPHITSLALPGVPAATQVMALDLDGIAVSAGAACSSGKVVKSHVLAAMGLEPALLDATIRVSLGWNSTTTDVERFLDAWGRLADRRRRQAA